MSQKVTISTVYMFMVNENVLKSYLQQVTLINHSVATRHLNIHNKESYLILSEII